MLVLGYSTFEKTKLREGLFNKSPIPPGQGKFLPLLSQGATGLGSQMKKLRNITSAVQEHGRELGKLRPMF